MIPWLLIPVKSLESGKSRLFPLCSDKVRRDLNEFFLRQMLLSAGHFPGHGRTAVISQSEEVLRLVEMSGARAIRQTSAPGLNRAANEGFAALRNLGAKDILLIACDEPLVQPSDIREIVERGAGGNSVVICPDKHSTGTNAIYVPASVSIQFRFGESSCIKHVREAIRSGLSPKLHFNANVALDIDTPRDLTMWLNRCDGSIDTARRRPRKGKGNIEPTIPARRADPLAELARYLPRGPARPPHPGR
jgi:2-phospho-L-lactate guanylyltransferase